MTKTGRHDTNNQRSRRHGKGITLYMIETVPLGIHLKHVHVTGKNETDLITNPSPPPPPPPSLSLSLSLSLSDTINSQIY